MQLKAIKSDSKQIKETIKCMFIDQKIVVSKKYIYFFQYLID